MQGRGASAHRSRSALLLRSQETAPQPPCLHPQVHGPLHQTSLHCDLGRPQLPGPRRRLPLSPPPARASQLPPLRPVPRGQARPAGSSRPRPPALATPTCPSSPTHPRLASPHPARPRWAAPPLARTTCATEDMSSLTSSILFTVGSPVSRTQSWRTLTGWPARASPRLAGGGHRATLRPLSLVPALAPPRPGQAVNEHIANCKSCRNMSSKTQPLTKES